MRYEATFTPTQEDLITAFRMHNHHGQVSQTFIFTAGGFLLLGLAALAYYSRSIAVFLIGAPVGILTIGTFLLPDWLVVNAAKKTKSEELTIALSEDGVEFATAGLQSRHTWDLVAKASIDERGLLLYTDAINYSFVPARAFRGGYPQEALRALLVQNLRKPNQSLQPTRFARG